MNPISHQSYNNGDESKQNIINKLESKFLSNVLPPKTSTTKKHNFVNSSQKQKDGECDRGKHINNNFWKSLIYLRIYRK